MRYQHEYMDGSGYPFGRYGKDIPADAQMLCIASEYVAMTTPRLYRAGLALTLIEADAYLCTQIGKRYSARTASLFHRAKETERLRLALLRVARFVLGLVLKVVSNRPRLGMFSRRTL